ncbi:MAG: tRNA pseudouridine(55) synthase TruB [bacterium]|nr:tRNA pseudouridine(55) synthase TruB [bacterium]
MTDWSGLLLVDKPEGPTSHDIVARVRRATGQRRIGHGGTLDPPASGLLPLVLGPATRLVRFLPHSPKTYVGTFRLGLETSTDDTQGEVLARHDGDLPPATRVVERAGAMIGTSLQVPPNVSARKVGGQRLYRLARAGREIDAPAAEVTIERFDVEPTDEPATFTFVASVSGGTYIRSMVRDLGGELACGGALASLRRTRIGPLDIADAAPVPADGSPDPELLRERLIPPSEMPLAPPSVRLATADEARGFTLGQAVESGEKLPDSGYCRVTDAGGRLLGIGEITEGRRIKPRVVIAPPL